MRVRYAVFALVLAAVLSAAVGWMERVPDRYFRESEVDRKAYPLRRVDLPYPQGPDGLEFYGTLRLDVRIDERGVVDRVEVLASSVPAAFREGAVRAFAAARFEPALRGGRKVKSVKRVEVRLLPPSRGLARDA